MVLRQILLHAPAYGVLEPQMLTPYARKQFEVKTGDLIDEQTRERMRRFLNALFQYVERFEEPATAYERST